MTTAALAAPQTIKAPIQLNDGGMPMIRTIEDAFRLAEMAMQSGLVPSGFKNAQAVMIAWQFGAELGLTRMQSLFNIAVVNGRPSIWGKAIVGIVMSKGVLEDFKEHLEGTGEDRTAIVMVKRKGLASECTKRFSVAQARKAGLMAKDTYQKYVDDMITYKARARAFSTLFGDVLCGLPLAEDILEVIANEPASSGNPPTQEPIKDALLEAHVNSQPSSEPIDGDDLSLPPADVEPQKFEEPPVSEASALAAENANALGVPPEDIPPAKIETPKPVNSPGITVQTEAPKVFKCKACQDSQKNSKGGPCPLCAPKKFDSQNKGTDAPKSDPAPLKNQADAPKSPPVEPREVTFEKPPIPLGKGNFKYQSDEGDIYYSNATGVKSVVDANLGTKISIGVQEIDSRMIIVSARQI